MSVKEHVLEVLELAVKHTIREAMEIYTVKVEESKAATNNKPSAGPVYRCVYAKNGLLELPPGFGSPWEFFCRSVEKFPQKQMLGHRQITDGKASPYIWQTYEEVHLKAIKVGSAIRRCGLNTGDRCGIYGANCPEWLITMEACSSQGLCYVPLYDTLGAHAVEFIINHAEVSIAFVQENKIPFILECLPKCSSFLRTIVSFGLINSEQKNEAEKVGVNCFSWMEFLSSVSECCGLPSKSLDDICTIMYTSGTTGEPKGVILTNKAIMAEVINTDYLLSETDKVVHLRHHKGMS